eukprot:NODE_17_length_48642_cov_1.199349.p35 type:complete len:159 gc:universal NODE_17_length_48642_cov_1.199349:36778-37254(+)
MSEQKIFNKHDSILSLQCSIEDNTQYLQQIQDNNIGQVLMKVEEQLQENFLQLTQLEKNMEKLHVDMHNEIEIHSKIDKLYSALNERKDSAASAPEKIDRSEENDQYMLNRISNRVDTLSRHFNHLNNSVNSIMKKQECFDEKMNKLIKKLDTVLGNK